MTSEFKELRRNLPWNYISRIAEEVPEVTRRQVRGVFKGEITNHETITKVMDGAIKVLHTTQIRDKELCQKIKVTKRYTRKRLAA